jgi:divalent metal cation (Fe/Co/Zn/Cd) transporter
MNTQFGFIVKILLFSTALSFLIKYGGRFLSIQPTNIIVLGIVLLPTIILAVLLIWQYDRLNSSETNSM